jgi:ubiquinone biosynthesis protein COQ9
MFDDMSNRSRIITAAMTLAAERGWADIGLPDIAEKAGLNMAELRKDFSSKTAVLSGFRREIDAAVLAKFPQPSAGQSARDRLFDVMMTRFEIAQPYKRALQRIVDDLRRDPAQAGALLRPTMSSMYWMLQAAGISGEGPAGLARVSGLVSIYSQVLHVWFDDDDPALSRTMAALDRRLRRAESVTMRINSVCEAGRRAVSAMSPMRSARPSSGGASGMAAPEPGPQSPPASSSPGAPQTF